MAGLRVDIQETGGDLVVKAIGEVDVSSATLLETRLVQTARRTVVLDLSGVSFLDASGLGAILHAREKIAADGHELSIRGAVGIVRRVFDITDLSHLLDD
jgi:anti-sigma B factor antagonist